MGELLCHPLDPKAPSLWGVFPQFCPKFVVTKMTMKIKLIN